MSQPTTQQIPTTQVSGYFNNNTYPISVSLSSLGVSVLVNPGGFIIDRRGRKINDPVLESCCKADMLAREVSDKPVPIIFIKPAVTIGPADVRSPGFTAVTGAAYKAGTTPLLEPKLPATSPAVNTPAIRGYTMDEARKLGLVGRPVEMKDTAPADSGQAPPSGDSLPYIDVPRETFKGEIVKDRTGEQLLDTASVIAEGVTSSPARVPVPLAAEPVRPSPVVEELPEPVFSSAPPPPPPAGAVVDVVEVVSSGASADPIEEEAQSGDHVCGKCGLKYNYRSELKRHAQRKHADMVEKILTADDSMHGTLA
jgi:hypothetical protein